MEKRGGEERLLVRGKNGDHVHVCVSERKSERMSARVGVSEFAWSRSPLVMLGPSFAQPTSPPFSGCRKNVSDASYFVVKQLFGLFLTRRRFRERKFDRARNINDETIYTYTKRINCAPLQDFGSNGSNDKTSCGEHPTDKRIVDCVCPNRLPFVNGAAEPNDDDFDDANPKIPTAARPPTVRKTFFFAEVVFFLVSPSSFF